MAMHPISELKLSDISQIAVERLSGVIRKIFPDVSCTDEEARAAIERHGGDVAKAGMEFLTLNHNQWKNQWDIKFAAEIAEFVVLETKCTEEARTTLEKHDGNVTNAVLELQLNKRG